MSIFDKIDEIRRKPEHIRMRYVWVCVGISMSLVLAIWALSIKSRSYQYEMETPGQVAGQVSIFDELKAQKESLNEYQQQMSDIGKNVQNELQDIQDQQIKQDVSSQPENLTETEMAKELLNYGNSQNAVPDTASMSNPASLFQ